MLKKMKNTEIKCRLVFAKIINVKGSIGNG